MTQLHGETLLPCPFCGGEAKIERVGTARQSCIIACQECGCRLETGEVWTMGEQWNTRHHDHSEQP
jgi:Lar family restriction alleviation protein